MKLILCADDFAQHEAIDQAIIELIKQKRLSAASCMVLSPRWPAAANKLTAEIRKQASIGLHLDFTHFGDAISHPKLILRSLCRQLSKHQIQKSIRAQLDAFEAATGTPPDYVDGHQHVHQLPQIRDALLEILVERYNDRLPWVRVAKPPVTDGIKGLIIRLLGASAFERKAKKMGFVCSGNLLGAYGFNGSSEAYQARLSQWLTEANQMMGNIPVLMCHPAISVAQQPEDDAIYPARTREYVVLASDKLVRDLERFSLVKSPSD